VATGAATAALLGLLFVAVSIRVETIAKSAELRNRSAQTLTLLLTGLLAAVLLAVPDQRKWALAPSTSYWPSSSPAWHSSSTAGPAARVAARSDGSWTRSTDQ
jgi:hypothetical protein